MLRYSALVIDNESSVNTELAIGLAERQYNLTHILHPYPALTRIRAGLHPDIIISDMRGYGEQERGEEPRGIVLARQARVLLPDARIYLWTGHYSDRNEGRLAGLYREDVIDGFTFKIPLQTTKEALLLELIDTQNFRNFAAKYGLHLKKRVRTKRRRPPKEIGDLVQGSASA